MYCVHLWCSVGFKSWKVEHKQLFCLVFRMQYLELPYLEPKIYEDYILYIIHQYHLIRLLRNSKLPKVCWERTDHFLSLSSDKNMNCSRMDDALCSLQIRIRGGLQLQSRLPVYQAQWGIIVGRLVTSRANRQLLRSAALSLDHIYLLLSPCPHQTYGDKLIPKPTPA